MGVATVPFSANIGPPRLWRRMIDAPSSRGVAFQGMRMCVCVGVLVCVCVETSPNAKTWFFILI